MSGGIGDLLKATHLLGPISSHFSCAVTVITDQHAIGQVAGNNPYVSDTLLVPVTQDIFDFVDRLRDISVFDLIILWRYVVDYVTPAASRIRNEDVPLIESNPRELRQVLEKYRSQIVLPKFNYVFAPFSREVARLGLSALKVSVTTSGLPHGDPGVIPFFPGKQSLRVIAGLLTYPYVTIHHGFDVEFLPAKTRNTDYRSTKNVSMQQWREIVSLIRKKGIEVIQLGVVAEETIEGVTRCLNGQTSLEETSLLIKHGLCHIDTEGGLVHLANAVHARSVVLFGPTPAEFFGYPQNINLEPSLCKGCWFATKNWLIECARHTRGPECMKGHSASSVADAVDKIVAESENISAKLMAAETRPSPTRVGETVATAQIRLGHDAASRALFIFDDLPADICSELSDGVLKGSHVIVCADKLPRPEPNDRAIGRFEYGSLLNLPRASSSTDAAVWVSRELESDIAPFALREIFRVLKPGGQLVFAAVGESTGLDLRRSLSAARIALDGMRCRPFQSTPVLCAKPDRRRWVFRRRSRVGGFRRGLRDGAKT